MSAKKISDFRVFVGLALPAPLTAELAFLQSGFSRAVRLVDPADFHITLTFIGGLDSSRLQDADEALASVHASAFDLTVTGAGVFAGGHGPHHLWMGVADSPPLHALKSKIDRALDGYGLAFERRKYSPHITLAHVKPEYNDEAGVFIQRHNLFSSAPFRVGSFCLFRSHPDHPPPRYEVLAEYPLTP